MGSSVTLPPPSSHPQALHFPFPHIQQRGPWIPHWFGPTCHLPPPAGLFPSTPDHNQVLDPTLMHTAPSSWAPALLTVWHPLCDPASHNMSPSQGVHGLASLWWGRTAGRSRIYCHFKRGRCQKSLSRRGPEKGDRQDWGPPASGEEQRALGMSRPVPVTCSTRGRIHKLSPS